MTHPHSFTRRAITATALACARLSMASTGWAQDNAAN